MTTEPRSLASLRRDFIRNVVAPAVTVVLLALLGCGFTAWWVTIQSNSKAQEKQQQVIENLFSQHLAEFASQHQLLLSSGDVATLLAQPAAASRALLAATGDSEVWLLDAGRQPQVAWQAGNPAALSAWATLSPQLTPWLDAQQHSPFAADYIRLHGRVAQLASGLVSYQNQPHTLLFIRYLSAGFVDFLQHRGVVSDFHFAAAGPGEAGFLLSSKQQVPVSEVAWQPMRPGSQMLMITGPLIAFAIISISLVCLVMIRRLWRSSLQLSRSVQQLADSEARASHLAYHDRLTGLPNRAWIDQQLSQRLAQLAGNGQRFALLLLDLDRFKLINDTYGHPTGDRLLVEIAQRLNALLPESATTARLGGDEFVVMLDPLSSEAQLDQLCRQILQRLAESLSLHGNTLWVGASIGVALAPDHSRDRLELMRQADIALYAAKAEGRGRYCLFDPHMDEQVQKRHHLAQQLRQALESACGLSQWYQPVIDGRNGRIIMVEALLRWQHPQLGSVSPAEFIPIAEESGLIVPLGEWVLEQACQLAATYPQLTVAVNISPLQFLDAHFTRRLTDKISQHGITPQQIELEITEGVLLENEQQALSTINTLRAQGFAIALDDFGTGFSSLSYLVQFPVDTIKIDQTFTRALGVRENSATIVRSVISLGHSLGITVTAEGVETAEQQAMLLAAGCDRLQGYLLSKPLSASQLHSLLSRQTDS